MDARTRNAQRTAPLNAGPGTTTRTCTTRVCDSAMKGAHTIPFLAAALCACATSGGRDVGALGQTMSSAAAFALSHGCPEIGSPARAVRRVLGAPDLRDELQAPESGARELWTYSSRAGSELLVSLAGDSVIGWDARGVDHRTLPPRLRGATPEVVSRVQAHLGSRAPTSAKVAYALYNRCILVGMSEDQIRASQGPTLSTESTTVGEHLVRRLIVPIGFEGQKLVIELSGFTNRVVSWFVRDPRAEPAP